ncbi:protein-export chaperone SecB [Algiphilus sp.]|uniref:protein-export chaperone SecB n=1 Tax=Algiphilus sp. TaxID=1872431 RepID=UPI0025BA7D92|nr:protein-export chaperone SecB [Algiphilus sp.]MCI5061908.1 protein-export chaperone SecB [Algiphilus sp.]MCI5103348.1 protein-export chaperone SecB [Algiphilus sp.]MCR9089951.1 protein-export chaperone SecB [Pseudomonadota bacterium]
MAEEQKQRQLSLQKIFLKDASLEIPKAPAIFQRPWNPTVDVNLATSTHALEQTGYFQVALRITVTAKLEEDVALIIEIEQAGLFLLEGFGDQEIASVLNTHCPQVLFPYAREAVSNLAERGGFQQLLLQPVNFEALYRQHLERQQQQSAGNEATTATVQ